MLTLEMRGPTFNQHSVKYGSSKQRTGANTLPEIKRALSKVPRLGVRSGGQGGTTPGLAAVINAIVDALSELGVRHTEMRAAPEWVWRTIQAARGTSRRLDRFCPKGPDGAVI